MTDLCGAHNWPSVHDELRTLWLLWIGVCLGLIWGEVRRVLGPKLRAWLWHRKVRRLQRRNHGAVDE